MCAAVASQTQSLQSDSSSSQNPRCKVSSRPLEAQLLYDEIKITDTDDDANKLDDSPLDYDEMYDEFMNLNQRKIMFNSKVSRIFITENDEPVGEIQHNGIFDEIQSSIPFQRLGFESDNHQKTQMLSNCNDLLRDDVKSTSTIKNDGISIIPIQAAAAINLASGIQNALQISFQQQFDNQFKKYAEYESRQEQEATINLIQMLEGICGMEFKNSDPKSVVISPTERQILVSKVWWKHAK
ncbi:MAG: hypothetical protein EZS28_033431 [Streblomastix strix]|uniref:Uncharacterized protein n=1 Tax=Streblomastix strix TaxID=222440 RepID=A0A5J4UL90_9EUKA|nr:MAG: hypothetical protein EZS28_033431 [Streblomastix strix]